MVDNVKTKIIRINSITVVKMARLIRILSRHRNRHTLKRVICRHRVQNGHNMDVVHILACHTIILRTFTLS